MGWSRIWRGSGHCSQRTWSFIAVRGGGCPLYFGIERGGDIGQRGQRKVRTKNMGHWER